MPSGSQVRQSLYEDDFFEWTRQQAQLLRERRFADLDLDHLTEEVESVGASEKREIYSRLRIILAHLLKWKYQPGARSNAWRGTLDEQRRRLRQVVDASPSLRGYPGEVFLDCYLSGRLLAAKDTGMDLTLFPDHPPFSIEQALAEEFLPPEPDLIDPAEESPPS